jgi:hypothetical protein
MSGYIDEIMAASGVHGIDRVGYDPSGIMRVGADGNPLPPGVSAPPSPPFGRSGRYVFRRAPLGFPSGTVAANASFAFVTQQVSRVYHPDRLLIIPAAPGLVIDSIRVGDEEQTVTAGAAVELYGVEALTDSEAGQFLAGANRNDRHDLAPQHDCGRDRRDLGHEGRRRALIRGAWDPSSQSSFRLPRMTRRESTLHWRARSP